jgi:hypothetical protein
MPIWWMELLKRLEFGEESIEAAQEFVDSRRISRRRLMGRMNVEDGRY